MRYLNTFILTVAAALVLNACGSSPTKTASTAAPAKREPADVLATEALAVYRLQNDGARAWTLISEATKQAPDRADLAHLQARLCQLLEGCRPEPYEARLRQLDPSNGVVWMRSLEQAQHRREPKVEAQILDALGQAQRFDVYWNSLGARVAGVRIANGSRSDAALGETVTWLGSTIVPSLEPLTRACSRSRTARQPWAERCRRIARVLMNGDTYIAESVGTTLAQQVTADNAEQIQLSERALTARYLWRNYAAITSSQVERDKFATELIELMRTLHREQDIHLAVARWSGRPVTPPRGWTDEGM